MAVEDLDEIHLHDSEASPTHPILVYLITGNPGLASFYTVFLTDLFQRLQTSTNLPKKLSFHVYASSLPGFEVSRPPPNNPHQPPYNLRETITAVRERLQALTKRLNEESGAASSDRRLPVILMGHSVGTYILLEILASLQNPASTNLSPDIQGNQERVTRGFDIKAGICLFPTIVDIAKSPMGSRLSPLAKIPYLHIFAHQLARSTLGFLPLATVARVVSAVNGMPSDAATTTARFLQSPWGVRQALWLARHELEEMTDDRWGEEIWGAATATATATSTSDFTTAATRSRPQLFFYWGRSDHWIAETTRERIIAARGRRKIKEIQLDGGGRDDESWKPRMDVDEMGVPHDFCIRHSRPIAAKAAEYIEEILNPI